MSNQPRQSFAFLPCCSQAWVWIAKPVKSGVKKFICGRSAPTGALSVKRPAKNQLRRTIMFSSHPSEPMVDECGFSDPSPGNDCNDIDILVCPCTVQKSNILLSTKNITSRNGQSGYRDFLRSKFSWRLASSDTRSARGCLLQALTSDSTPCVDSACYRRYRLEKFGRGLKAMPGVFFEKHFK